MTRLLEVTSVTLSRVNSNVWIEGMWVISLFLVNFEAILDVTFR